MYFKAHPKGAKPLNEPLDKCELEEEKN